MQTEYIEPRKIQVLTRALAVWLPSAYSLSPLLTDRLDQIATITKKRAKSTNHCER